MRCPSCGVEYAAWALRCPDCGVALVPDAGGAVLLDEPGEEQLVYELGAWTPEMREELGARLAEAGVPFAWEAADLVVRTDDEEVVDRELHVVDPEVEPTEEPVGDAGPGAGGADEEGQPELVYDLEVLSDEQRGDLVAELARLGVPHAWDDPVTLAVPLTHEEVVEAVLDRVEFPHALPEAEPEEEDERAHAMLSELFLASDRLQHDGADREGVEGLLAALEGGVELGPPFGVDPASWDRARGLAEELGEAVRAEDLDGAEGLARTLRQLLRPLI